MGKIVVPKALANFGKAPNTPLEANKLFYQTFTEYLMRNGRFVHKKKNNGTDIYVVPDGFTLFILNATAFTTIPNQAYIDINPNGVNESLLVVEASVGIPAYDSLSFPIPFPLDEKRSIRIVATSGLGTWNGLLVSKSYLYSN